MIDTIKLMNKESVSSLNRYQLDIIEKSNRELEKIQGVIFILVLSLIAISVQGQNNVILRILQLCISIAILVCTTSYFIYERRCINKIYKGGSE